MKNDNLFDDVDFGELFGGLEEAMDDVSVVEKPHKKEIEEPDGDPDPIIEEPTNVVDVDDEDKNLESPLSSVKDIDDNDSSSDYRVFAKALYESGVIQDFDEDKFSELAEDSGEDEALISLITETINKEVDSRLTTKEDRFKEVMTKIEGGVPADVVATQLSDMERLNGITDDQLSEDEELAKRVIAIELRYHGYSPERINRRIQALDDTGIIGEESIESLKSIKALRQKEIAEEDKRYQAEQAKDKDLKKQRFDSIKNSIYSTDELIPGIKLNKLTKDKMLATLTKPVASDEGKEKNAIMHHRDKNPIAFDQMVAYLYNIGAFNLDSKGNPNPKWDKILKTSKSNAVSELSNRFSKPSRKSGGSPISKFDNNDGEESFITSIDVDNFGKFNDKE